MPSLDNYTTPDGKVWIIRHEGNFWIAISGDLVEQIDDSEGRMGMIVFLNAKYSV